MNRPDGVELLCGQASTHGTRHTNEPMEDMAGNEKRQPEIIFMLPISGGVQVLVVPDTCALIRRLRSTVAGLS